LSAAFDFVLSSQNNPSKRDQAEQVKRGKVKSGGQQCPPHMSIAEV
jgi:hypothetical protein